MIITFNLGDFPAKTLLTHGIEAHHPDIFLRYLLDIAPSKVIQTINETRKSLKNPPKSPKEYLDILKNQSLMETVQYLSKFVDLI